MPLKPEDPQAIVAAHNAYRSDPAIHAPNLVWDSTLATGAQQWAENLAANVHDLAHSGSDVRGNNVGENIAASGPGSLTPAQMVDQWGKGVPGMADADIEQKNFQPGIFSGSTTTCAVSKTGNWQDVGHYTQMIWNDTTSVGCGFASDSKYDYLVCRYAPAGNVTGVRVPAPQPQPVTLAQVSVANATTAVGVDAANNVYRFTSVDGTTWTRTSITGQQMKQVSVASDGTLCGLDSNGAIWQTSITGSSQTWTQMAAGPVAFRYMSCGSASNSWAVGTNGFVYRNTGADWTQRAGSQAQGITVASDGTIWAIDGGGYPVRYINESNSWDQSVKALGYQFLQISCGSATTLWGIGLDGQYWKLTGNSWTQAAPGTGKQVSVASDGTAWSIGADNKVYRLVNNAWTALVV